MRNKSAFWPLPDSQAMAQGHDFPSDLEESETGTKLVREKL
jgi:hypothetical protein